MTHKIHNFNCRPLVSSVWHGTLAGAGGGVCPGRGVTDVYEELADKRESNLPAGIKVNATKERTINKESMLTRRGRKPPPPSVYPSHANPCPALPGT